MAFSCGIDFGTSNSAIAQALNSKVSLVPIEGTNTTIPSAIFYSPDVDPLFGRAAVKTFVERENGRFMRSFKRVLGTGLMQSGTIVNGKRVMFEDIITDFLSHIKNRAEEHTQKEFQNVVLGRPVHFVDSNSEADLRAQNNLEDIAKKSGFKNISFQFEPIAAAFSHEQFINEEKLALIVDIGGGTSDFTVIRLSPDGKEKSDRSADILANAGVRVGGNDFDKDFSINQFMAHFGYQTTYGDKNLIVPVSPFHEASEWSKINFLYTPQTMRMMRDVYAQSHRKRVLSRFIKLLEDEEVHLLLAEIERTKILLTDQKNVLSDLTFLEPSLGLEISREDFNKGVLKQVEKIKQSMVSCLRQAGVTKKEIDLIVLTGGTSEIPILKESICALFPHVQVSDKDKFSSVVQGLAHDSLRKFG